MDLNRTPAKRATSKHHSDSGTVYRNDVRPFHLAESRLVRQSKVRSRTDHHNDQLDPEMLLLPSDVIVADPRVVVSP